MMPLMNRVTIGVPLISLVWTQVLPAMAQTAQNTTYSYLYDNMGNLTQVTDALGNVSNLVCDPLLRVKQQVMPATASGVARPAVNLTYDGLDQSATVIDPRNLTTTYSSETVQASPKPAPRGGRLTSPAMC